jgi:hypothetical protein
MKKQHREDLSRLIQNVEKKRSNAFPEEFTSPDRQTEIAREREKEVTAD